MKIDWKKQYQYICERDKTDGEIFWNKVSVLTAVNFGLIGLLSLGGSSKEESPTSLIVIISGGLFSFFWLFVLMRQSKWVQFWKKELAMIETNHEVNISVQTDGDKFEKGMRKIWKIGGYRNVAWIFPTCFMLLWLVVLLIFWKMGTVLISTN